MPPDIDGAYEFKITGEDENTPTPDNDTAYNDKDGTSFSEMWNLI